MIPGKQYRPEDVLRILWRRKWIIALPLVVISAATATYVHYLPNAFRSETMILVVPQRVPESYVQSTVTMRIEDRLQSISQQILSRPRLERIVQDFNLYPELRKTAIMEDIVEQMRTREIVVQVVKGDAFRVSYVSVDPRLAMRVTERLASLFIEENLRDREVLAEGTNEFLESQLEDARRRLVEHEQKLADYRLRHADEMPGRFEANLQAQHNAEMQVQALVNVLSIDRDRRRTVERQIAELADLALATEAVQKPVLRDDDASGQGTATEVALARARASLASIELRLKPEHPDVIRTKREIAELEKQEKLEAQFAAASRGDGKDTLVLSPAERARESRLSDLRVSLDVMNREIAAKEEQEAQLRAAIDVYQQRAQAVPVRETELADLTRDYQTIQQLYQSLLGKYESSKISANLERRQQSEQFRVLEPAHLPERPFSPDRLRLNLMGATLGLALGLGLTIVLEYFDTSLRSEDDVLLALGVPVLALVPHVVAEDERLQLRRRKMIWGVTAATTAATTAAVVVWMLRL